MHETLFRFGPTFRFSGLGNGKIETAFEFSFLRMQILLADFPDLNSIFSAPICVMVCLCRYQFSEMVCLFFSFAAVGFAWCSSGMLSPFYILKNLVSVSLKI
jgi:hypothetical protein